MGLVLCQLPDSMNTNIDRWEPYIVQQNANPSDTTLFTPSEIGTMSSSYLTDEKYS